MPAIVIALVWKYVCMETEKYQSCKIMSLIVKLTIVITFLFT